MIQNTEIINKDAILSMFTDRTILYNLEPIGIGTPYVESLSSYLVRLAANHQVQLSVLLNKLIEPYLTSSFVKKELKEGITKDTSTFINENNFVTLDFVNVLEFLTGRNDLRALTILNWTGLINERSISYFRKWCPLCLEEMQINSSEIYEPLLWYMKMSETCEVHNVKLQNSCWNCDKNLRFLGSKISMGFCQYCKCWLGKSRIETSIEVDECEKFNISCIKEMLAHSADLEWYPTSKFISNYLRNVYLNSDFTSVRKMTFHLGFWDGTINSWMNTSRRPSNNSLLRLIRNFNTTFIGFLSNEGTISIQNYSMNEGFSKIEVEKLLLQELSSNKSINRIAKEKNINIDFLKKNFPELCKEITRKSKENKQAEISKQKKKIYAILEENLRADVPKSVTRIFKENNISYVTGKRYAPELVKEVASRYKNFLNTNKKNRTEKIINEMATIIKDLHDKGISPTTYKVSLKLSFTAHELRKPEVFAAYIEILKSYGYDIK